MSTQLIFYTNPMSRGRIVRWMLEELKVAYTTQILDYGTSMKSVEYLAINPLGKVPALQHDSTIITETAAICAYLAESFPEVGLAPQTNAERGAYYRWMFFAAGPLEQLSGLKTLGIEPTPEQEKYLGCGNPKILINTLCQAVKDSPYLAGDRFTAADICVGSFLGWGMHMGSIESQPELINYWQRISERPARLAAVAIDDALLQTQA